MTTTRRIFTLPPMREHWQTALDQFRRDNPTLSAAATIVALSRSRPALYAAYRATPDRRGPLPTAQPVTLHQGPPARTARMAWQAALDALHHTDPALSRAAAIERLMSSRPALSAAYRTNPDGPAPAEPLR